MRFHVYILASMRNGTLYLGVTRDLVRRMEQHRSLGLRAFAASHGVTRLVYAEAFEDVREAIAREKQLKGWKRAWKLKLIEAANPDWDDLDPSAC